MPDPLPPSIDEIAAQLAAMPDPEPLSPDQERELAIVAAQQVNEAATSLLLFVREGAATDWHAFDAEVTGLLAEALRSALTIDAPRLHAPPELDPEGDERRRAADLIAAINRYLEDWVP